MPPPLFSCEGGSIALPMLPLCDRRDGGHLIVDPPRPVWDRSALSADELARWSCLVAATGRAMLECLPALAGGCLNYWDAGNWSLHPQAEPVGPKDPLRHRRMHLHIFGRSPGSADADWQWGEAPRFPAFSGARAWSQRFAALTADECGAIAGRAAELLATAYALPTRDGRP